MAQPCAENVILEMLFAEFHAKIQGGNNCFLTVIIFDWLIL